MSKMCAVDIAKSCIVLVLLPVQCAMQGYDKLSYHFYFANFLLIPTSWEWMSTGSSIKTASKSHLNLSRYAS